MMQARLKEWLRSEMERRGWSTRMAAARAGLAHTTVAKALRSDETISVETCVALARVFGQPVINVLEMAEYVPSSPMEIKERRLLLHIFEELDEVKRGELLRYAMFLVGR